MRKRTMDRKPNKEMSGKFCKEHGNFIKFSQEKANGENKRHEYIFYSYCPEFVIKNISTIN